jgi:hypothetical protein
VNVQVGVVQIGIDQASEAPAAQNMTKDSGRQLKLRWSTAVERAPGG